MGAGVRLVPYMSSPLVRRRRHQRRCIVDRGVVVPLTWPRRVDATSRAAFFEAFSRKDWDAVEALGGAILAQDPRQPRVRRRLAQSYEGQGRLDDAHSVVAEGLDRDLLSAIAATSRALYRELDLPFGKEEAWRLAPRGASAVCSIEHTTALPDGTSIFTKVLDPGTAWAGRELAFYTRLVGASTELAALAPRFVDYRPIEGSRFGMLTIERVNGRRATVDDFALIRDAWLALGRASDELTAARVQFRRSRARDRLRRLGARLLGRRELGIETAAWLHTPDACNDLFDACSARLQRHGASFRLRAAAAQLRSLWFERAIHRRVEPSRDYGLVHGDFHVGNILVETTSGACRIFDWEAYSWGPSGFDLCRMNVVRQRFEFDDMVRQRLLHPYAPREAGTAMSTPVASALLVVLTATRWLLDRSLRHLDDTVEQTIEPALNWLAER